MPYPMTRQGNVVYIERASFSKSHGATPTQCRIAFEAVANVALGTNFTIDVGGSVWSGRVIEAHVHKSESVGSVTEITCNDNRELLMSQQVFCQLNEIDRKTGALYCILDDDFVNALIDLGYDIDAADIPDPKVPNKKWGQLQEFSTWDVIYPQTVINVLCWLCRFDPPVLSLAARTILNSAATALNQGTLGTLQATNNFFGIDWQMGNKCGNALTHIAELLGLQFTLTDSDAGTWNGISWVIGGGSPKPRLHFFKIGEPSTQIPYTPMPVQGEVPTSCWPASEQTLGKALQTNVDTGVWITGERDVWEFQGVDLVPAWNQNWNRWGLKGEGWVLINIFEPLGMNIMGTTIGDLYNSGVSVPVNYPYLHTDGTIKQGSYNLPLASLYDPGFTDAGYFEDLSISDYLNKVFGKVFRPSIMDQFLSADEFSGWDANDNRVPVRFKPIHTPLLSDPSVPYHCYVTSVAWKDKRYRLKVSPPKTRKEKGHSLSDETGHIRFDNWQFRPDASVEAYTAANKGEIPPTNLTAPSIPTNIAPDAPAIDVCFYGPVYRKPFGNFAGFTESGVGILPRIGTKKISGLRHNKQIIATMSNPNDSATTPWAQTGRTVQEYMAAQPDYIPDQSFELPADDEAALVANAWLNQPHIVTSGEEHFGGFCGHEPDGEIRRVSVSVDGMKGISEQVAYSNDYPSLFHEPDIELVRRMGVDEALRKQASTKERDKHAQWKQLNDAGELTIDPRTGIDVTSQKRLNDISMTEAGISE